MKKLYATLFSALFLGGAICASCTDKKDASAEEVINTIHKLLADESSGTRTFFLG